MTVVRSGRSFINLGESLSSAGVKFCEAMGVLVVRGLEQFRATRLANNRRARQHCGRLSRRGQPPTVLTGAAIVGEARCAELFEAAYDEQDRKSTRLTSS